MEDGWSKLIQNRAQRGDLIQMHAKFAKRQEQAYIHACLDRQIQQKQKRLQDQTIYRQKQRNVIQSQIKQLRNEEQIKKIKKAEAKAVLGQNYKMQLINKSYREATQPDSQTLLTGLPIRYQTPKDTRESYKADIQYQMIMNEQKRNDQKARNQREDKMTLQAFALRNNQSLLKQQNRKIFFKNFSNRQDEHRPLTDLRDHKKIELINKFGNSYVQKSSQSKRADLNDTLDIQVREHEQAKQLKKLIDYQQGQSLRVQLAQSKKIQDQKLYKLRHQKQLYKNSLDQQIKQRHTKAPMTDLQKKINRQEYEVGPERHNTITYPIDIARKNQIVAREMGLVMPF